MANQGKQTSNSTPVTIWAWSSFAAMFPQSKARGSSQAPLYSLLSLSISLNQHSLLPRLLWPELLIVHRDIQFRAESESALRGRFIHSDLTLT